MEDSLYWSLERLRTDGFSEQVVRAIDSVTRRKELEDYEEFVLRAGLDPLGRIVKLADLEDNCDLSRIAEPTDQDHERVTKYRRAIEQLRRQEGGLAADSGRPS